ncbi:MAG TPA: V-type ATPase 116kDa subunit family protein [Actinomycetes bacterium]|nr:V-type ATPase 116kDa subunit family protein [Actinomycetes bacterium]
MPWRESFRPVGMQRVALLASREGLRDLLVAVADEGTVELDEVRGEGETGPPTPAALVLQRLQSAERVQPTLTRTAPDLEGWERGGRVDLIAGEAQVEQRAAVAVTRGSVAGLTGWMPSDALPRLARRASDLGAAVVAMPRPQRAEPPTLLPSRGSAGEFAPLVETYATVPYEDVNVSVLAGLAYVVMFGMMFADAGHGALLLLAAVAVRVGWWRRLAGLRRVWLFLAGAGLASIVFGVLYGEFFGPTGVVPVVWLKPLDQPLLLLGAAVAFGALLLAGAYALGTVNRFREGGWRAAAYSSSGLAGATVFLGLAMLAGGLYLGVSWLALTGGLLALVGLVLAYVGLVAEAGGGGAAATFSVVELVDVVVRLGANVVSFARLAAFGLTHAALGAVVFAGAVAAWRHGWVGAIAAIVLFIGGNALTFALEGVVAGIQALRLEYYELFSRIFIREGRPFRPWHVPLAVSEASC